MCAHAVMLEATPGSIQDKCPLPPAGTSVVRMRGTQQAVLIPAWTAFQLTPVQGHLDTYEFPHPACVCCSFIELPVDLGTGCKET